MGEGGSILDAENALALERRGTVQRQLGVGVDDFGVGLESAQ